MQLIKDRYFRMSGNRIRVYEQLTDAIQQRLEERVSELEKLILTSDGS